MTDQIEVSNADESQEKSLELIKIVARGGTSTGIKVTSGGVELAGITKIEINEIKPCQPVLATITVFADLDIEAKAKVIHK